MVGDGQRVHVGEGPHAQVAQHRLGRLHEADVGDTAEQRHADDDDRRATARRERESRTEPLVGQQTVVDDLLHEHRDGEPTDGADEVTSAMNSS